ncbi:hypothetical protein BDW42DRAFT_169452 [Aspergillus taichungensis]|uniref:Uncharacterized protein n=1 Tax=Aspergillus taichungensis TaxID=482145 RepID=A0A2J5HVI3_9EURO|nr:hypothetical protein BDW42DRAFT_169452 [Aspergillus taichungensis]
MKENALAGSCVRSQRQSGIRSHRCVESIGRTEVVEAGLGIGRIRNKKKEANGTFVTGEIFDIFEIL